MNTSTENTKNISFEFFPPKIEAGIKKLKTIREEFSKVNPNFFSVTYGAGGSTRDRTRETVIETQNQTGIETAPHLSCVGDTKEELRELINDYKSKGIKRIVALRGDLPSGMGASLGELKYASDLVTFIREESGDHFHLEVAAYPEMHPQAANMHADLQAFKTKVEAGADSAITQYFYNIDAYKFFVDSCEKMGIDIPIVAGIMPIINYENLMRFSNSCGAEVPRWIRMRLEAYQNDLESIRQFGEEVVTSLCEEVLALGAPGLHFYTMNQLNPSLSIWRNLNC
ncbi:MAG: methylenetetrahydrofolate reductase [NAD(P)H] [Gammaproteobacteria bacterium]|nr:MAG: methylenetetrahydrofolate reductase [NAD(P)H] [Gammaproteobacteria bacterium]